MNTVRECRGGHRNPDFGGKVWSSPCDPHGGPTQTCRIRTWWMTPGRVSSRSIPWRSQRWYTKWKWKDDRLPRWGPHGGNGKVMALWKEIYSGNDTMVSLCIWYIKSPVVHGSDGWRDWKGWQRQAWGWGTRLWGFIVRVKGLIFFLNIYILLKYSKVIQLYTYTYIIFQIISTIGYYKILTIGPCALQ